MKIVITYKMTPIGVRLNLKNFSLISYAVSELLRKVFQGGGIPSPPPPGEIGLNKTLYERFTHVVAKHGGLRRALTLLFIIIYII